VSLATWKSACGKAIIPVEREWLRATAAEIEAEFESPVIVNIGIFRGASLYCLRKGAPKAKLYGIDIIYPQGAILDKKARVVVIVGDSALCAADVEDPVHMVFVDGDHSYQGVKADRDAWAPKIAVGGIIAFHDFKTERRVAAKHAGIKRACLEWEEEQDMRWYLLPDVGSLRAYRRVAE